MPVEDPNETTDSKVIKTLFDNSDLTPALNGKLQLSPKCIVFLGIREGETCFVVGGGGRFEIWTTAAWANRTIELQSMRDRIMSHFEL